MKNMNKSEPPNLMFHQVAEDVDKPETGCELTLSLDSGDPLAELCKQFFLFDQKEDTTNDQTNIESQSDTESEASQQIFLPEATKYGEANFYSHDDPMETKTDLSNQNFDTQDQWGNGNPLYQLLVLKATTSDDVTPDYVSREIERNVANVEQNELQDEFISSLVNDAFMPMEIENTSTCSFKLLFNEDKVVTVTYPNFSGASEQQSPISTLGSRKVKNKRGRPKEDLETLRKLAEAAPIGTERTKLMGRLRARKQTQRNAKKGSRLQKDLAHQLNKFSKLTEKHQKLDMIIQKLNELLQVNYTYL